MTAAGLKKIEEIREGDLVLAYDEETGEQAYKPVVQLFRNESKDWTGVTVNGKEIISTPGHKYYLPESKTWVSAEDLKVGDEVLTSEGQRAIIKAVRPIHYETPQTTYNFEVEGFHTYYVGTGVLVHNKGCKDLIETENSLTQDGVKVEVRPGEALGKVAHHKPHAHVSGNGPNTTVGLNKLPVKQKHPPLSSKQSKVVNDNWKKIVKLIRKVWPK